MVISNTSRFIDYHKIIIIFVSLATTTTTTITTTTTTTVIPTFITAAWTFDLTTNDTYGVYNGAFINGANYLVASTTQPYIGYGRALTLSASSNQSFVVSTPFLNLTSTSFTVEAWIYPTNISNGSWNFQSMRMLNMRKSCFYFIVRSGRLYADFTFNGVYGFDNTCDKQWYHATFVYNYATQQQILYVNGVQDGIASNVGPIREQADLFKLVQL